MFLISCKDKRFVLSSQMLWRTFWIVLQNRDKMKKKNITLVFVAIVFSIIVGMIIGKSLLKYKEGEPDVVGSFSMNRDENFTVVANRKNISDKLHLNS